MAQAALLAACMLGPLVVARADSIGAPPELPDSLALEAPSNWGLLPGQSQKITLTASQTSYFGDEPTVASAIAYGHANHGALYLTWVDTTRAHPSPEAGLRAAFDNLHESPFLATTDSASTQEVLYRERNFDGVAELRFEWAHLNNDTVNLLRALGWKDADGRVHLAIAECVLSSESVSESRPLCDAALESLHLTRAARHEALRSLAPPKTVGSALHAEDIVVPKLELGEAPPTSSIGTAPADMGEVLYRGAAPPAREDKSNRFLIAIGLLLLGAAFWLTTRSKEAVVGASTSSEDEAEAKSEDEAAKSDAGNETDAKQEEEKAT
jgi:LPXTG-motif cell wall-anchored protein